MAFNGWKDNSAYAYLHPTTDVLIWRWEFLRRRDDYRADWKQHRGTGSADERIRTWISNSLVRVSPTGGRLIAKRETRRPARRPPRRFASRDDYLLALIRAPAAAMPSELASMPGSIGRYSIKQSSSTEPQTRSWRNSKASKLSCAA